MPPLGGGHGPEEPKQENPQPTQAESRVRQVTSVLVDFGAFDAVLKAFEKQQERNLVAIQRLEEQVKVIENRATGLTEMFSAATELQRMENEVAQQKLILSQKDKEIAGLLLKIKGLQPKPACVVHHSTYRLFGDATTEEEINADDNRRFWPFIRTWSTFVEWSENPDAKLDQFVAEFRKVDSALLKLRNDKDIKELNNLRNNVAGQIATTVSRNLFARITVTWDFVGQIIDSAKNFSSGGGQSIAFVKTALIARDGVVIDKAEVECQ